MSKQMMWFNSPVTPRVYPLRHRQKWPLRGNPEQRKKIEHSKFVEAEPALVRSLVPGVLKAKGVFETMLARGGEVVSLERHLLRMSNGLRVLHIYRPLSLPAIRRDIKELLRLNRLRNARVRLMVWRQAGRISSAILCEPLTPPSEAQYKKGFTAMLAKRRHRRATKVPVKSLDYAVFRQSLKDAAAAGFDEAILLNKKGEMVEGSRTNIFLVKDKVLFTPAVPCGCLPGVTRQAVLEMARKLKIHCIQRALNPKHLFEADEAFLTNALLGVMPLTSLDGKEIGNGKPGRRTLQLRNAYLKSFKD